jgi:hypothetical protein
MSRINGKKEIIEKIERWLQEEGYTSEKSDKPYDDFRSVIHPPYPNQNIGMDLYLEKHKTDKITITTKSVLTEQDQKAFSYLKPQTKQKFVHETKYSLVPLNIQFTFEPDAAGREGLSLFPSP